MNKDKYGRSCNKVTTILYIGRGEGGVAGSHHFSFNNDQIKTFTFMRTLAFIPSKKLQVKAKKKNAILEIFVKLFTISRESIVH
jgi:hypothetical protein